jgi:hypothetical protein
MADADVSLLAYLGKVITFTDLELQALFHSQNITYDCTKSGLVVAVQIPLPSSPVESLFLVQETTGLNYYDPSLIAFLDG